VGNNRRSPIARRSGRWLNMTDSVNTDQSDGTEMERWRNGNVTYSVNQPLLAPRPTHKLRTTHCPMAATAYSMYPQLLCISGGRSSVCSLTMRQAAWTGTPLFFMQTVTQNYGRKVVSSNGRMSAGVQISCSSVGALQSGFATCGTDDIAKTRPWLRITCLRITF
jgi:hypothetical protein